jgi:hypothetical protein
MIDAILLTAEYAALRIKLAFTRNRAKRFAMLRAFEEKCNLFLAK